MGYVKKGLPWTQIVKNRRKNGDHYWVEANATPIFEKGQITGYMSVRKPTTREQIKTAEVAYKAIAAGQLRIEGGRPVTAAHTFMKPLRKLSIATQLLWVVLALGSIPFVLNLLDFSVLSWTVEVGVLIMAMIVFAIGRQISKQMEANAQVLSDMANANFDTPVEIYADANLDELPERYRLAAQLKSMQTKLGNDFDETQHLLNEALRVQIALDVTTANIMVADQNNTVVFMNEALYTMLKGLEGRLKEALPHFDAESIVGQNVDIFHAHPEHQRGMIATYKIV